MKLFFKFICNATMPILMTFLLVIGCEKNTDTEKDDNGGLSPTGSECYILSLSYVIANVKFYDFRYSGNQQLSEVFVNEAGIISSKTISYDNLGQVSKIVYYEDGSQLMSQEFEYQDGLVRYCYEESNSSYICTYNYDDDDVLVSIDIGTNKLLGKIAFEWSDKNITRETMYSGDGSILEYYSLTYDSHPNPFCIFQFPTKLVGGPMASTFSKNNILKATWFSAINGETEIFESSYEYFNDTGYPQYFSSDGGYFKATYDCSPCTPLPTIPNAGPDQLNVSADFTFLEGNFPSWGNGEWSIESGNGGIIKNPLDPSSKFMGITGEVYKLIWTISNECGTNSDSVNIKFVFGLSSSCPGLDSIEYMGKYYHTVQINNQCWLKENLDAGIMINSATEQTDNGLIEKYCYDNLQSNCDSLGGMYQWNEMMQYIEMVGARGICPSGWHIPTDQDWKVLEGSVDGLFHVGDPIWDSLGWRGSEVGQNLKAQRGWDSGGNGNDMYGFNAKPAGYGTSFGTFIWINTHTFFWTSNNSGIHAYYRELKFDQDKSWRHIFDKNDAYSVRCIRD